VERGAKFEALDQEGETSAGFLVGEAEGVEHLVLNVAAVNTDGAGAERDAVENQVVRVGAAVGGVGDMLVQVLVVNRCEGVVGGAGAYLGHGAGEVALEALGVVVDAQAAVRAERFQWLCTLCGAYAKRNVMAWQGFLWESGSNSARGIGDQSH
jgi:hypothetical protein